MSCATKLATTALLVVPLALAAIVRADDWPQWRGANRDGVWNESGIPQEFPPGGLKPRWRLPVGVGFATPVVVGGLVYVTDSELTRPKARERVRALDALTGEERWKYAYDVDYPDWAFDEKNPLGPRATPIVKDGRIYTVGIFGDVACLDALKGDLVWQRDLRKDSADGKVECTGSPLIEGDLLIVFPGAKPAACLVALDKNTGRKVWSALDESGTFSSPIVIAAGRTRQLIVWTRESVTSLDPTTGRTHWRQPLNTAGDFVVSTPVVQGNLLLVSGLMLKLDAEKPAASVLWPKSRAASARLLSHTSTAVFHGDYIFSAKSLGELVCLEAKTGSQVWATEKATAPGNGASIHITPNGQSFLLFNDRGELIRARLSADGYHEIARAKLLEPTFPFGGRKFAWVPPAFAHGHLFARNDKELICVPLAKEP